METVCKQGWHYWGRRSCVTPWFRWIGCRIRDGGRAIRGDGDPTEIGHNRSHLQWIGGVLWSTGSGTWKFVKTSGPSEQTTWHSRMEPLRGQWSRAQERKNIQGDWSTIVEHLHSVVKVSGDVLCGRREVCARRSHEGEARARWTEKLACRRGWIGPERMRMRSNVVKVRSSHEGSVPRFGSAWVRTL